MKYKGSSKQMPVGRPTKYNKEVIEKALNYLKNYETEHKDAIPSVVGLACVLNIRRETLHVWAKDENKAEFSNILDQINNKQQRVLLSKGLTGDFNSNITKLVLGKHGYHDKQETELTGSDKNPVKILIEVVDGKGKNT